MLEASGFDFRNRHPQKLLVKLLKQHGLKKDDEVGMVAYCISLDLYRTFAPLKQTTAAMAFACLELASRLLDAGLEDVEAGRGYENWNLTRAEVMGMFLPSLPFDWMQSDQSNNRNTAGLTRSIHSSSIVDRRRSRIPT